MRIIRQKVFNVPALSDKDLRRIKNLEEEIKQCEISLKKFPTWSKREGLDKRIEMYREDIEDIKAGKPVLPFYQKEYLKRNNDNGGKVTREDLLELTRISPKFDNPYDIEEMWDGVDYCNTTLNLKKDDPRYINYGLDYKKEQASAHKDLKKYMKLLNKVDTKGKFRRTN